MMSGDPHQLLEKLSINAKYLSNTCLQHQFADSCVRAMVKQSSRNVLSV